MGLYHAVDDMCPRCRMGRLQVAYTLLECTNCGKKFLRDEARITAREIAMQLADDLFTDGWGNKAQRLVMELASGKPGGGWCHAAVVDRLAKGLEQHF